MSAQQPVTMRACLRNVLRRTGRMVPSTAASIAEPLTDDELSRLICGLLEILGARHSA